MLGDEGRLLLLSLDGLAGVPGLVAGLLGGLRTGTTKAGQ